MRLILYLVDQTFPFHPLQSYDHNLIDAKIHVMLKILILVQRMSVIVCLFLRYIRTDNYIPKTRGISRPLKSISGSSSSKANEITSVTLSLSLYVRLISCISCLSTNVTESSASSSICSSF